MVIITTTTTTTTIIIIIILIIIIIIKLECAAKPSVMAAGWVDRNVGPICGHFYLDNLSNQVLFPGSE